MSMKEKPTPPEEWECCESGCFPCVWDAYHDALREWNSEQKEQEEAQSQELKKTVPQTDSKP